MTITPAYVGAMIMRTLHEETDPVKRVGEMLKVAFGFNASEQGEPLSSGPPDLEERIARAARAACDAYYDPAAGASGGRDARGGLSA